MADQLVLHPPVKAPLNRSNLFGTPGPLYTASGQKGHPGLDFEAPSGTKVFAPCDGAAFYVTDFAYLVKKGLIKADDSPSDAGCGIWIRTPDNANPGANVILWHMYPKDNPTYPYGIPTDGSVAPVKAGQFLGYSDNSGYPVETNGPHVHMGYMPCDKTGEALNPANGYEGCQDPLPLLSSVAAEDVPAIHAVVAASLAVAQNVAASPEASVAQKMTWVSEIIAAVEKLL